MSREFVCQACYRIEPVKYALPPTCPQCGAAGAWRSLASDEPSRPYVLTTDDQHFLKSYRIRPE